MKKEKIFVLWMYLGISIMGLILTFYSESLARMLGLEIKMILVTIITSVFLSFILGIIFIKLYSKIKSRRKK